MKQRLIPEHIKSAFLDLLVCEYQYASRLNSVLKRLNEAVRLDLDRLFECLDYHKKGHLTESK